MRRAWFAGSPIPRIHPILLPPFGVARKQITPATHTVHFLRHPDFNGMNSRCIETPKRGGTSSYKQNASVYRLYPPHPCFSNVKSTGTISTFHFPSYNNFLFRNAQLVHPFKPYVDCPLLIRRPSVAYIHSQVAGVFTNLFGGVAGSKFGLKCTLLSSLILQASRDTRGTYYSMRHCTRLGNKPPITSFCLSRFISNSVRR